MNGQRGVLTLGGGDARLPERLDLGGAVELGRDAVDRQDVPGVGQAGEFGLRAASRLHEGGGQVHGDLALDQAQPLDLCERVTARSWARRVSPARW